MADITYFLWTELPRPKLWHVHDGVASPVEAGASKDMIDLLLRQERSLPATLIRLHSRSSDEPHRIPRSAQVWEAVLRGAWLERQDSTWSVANRSASVDDRLLERVFEVLALTPQASNRGVVELPESLQRSLLADATLFPGGFVAGRDDKRFDSYLAELRSAMRAWLDDGKVRYEGERLECLLEACEEGTSIRPHLAGRSARRYRVSTFDPEMTKRALRAAESQPLLFWRAPAGWKLASLADFAEYGGLASHTETTKP